MAIVLPLWCEKCPGVTNDKSMLVLLDYSMANVQKEKVKGKFLTFWQDSAGYFKTRLFRICPPGLNAPSGQAIRKEKSKKIWNPISRNFRVANPKELWLYFS